MTSPDRPHPVRYDAVVLAGGRATRLGGVPKPTVVVGGAPLLDHALAATSGAERTVVVGPEPTTARTAPEHPRAEHRRADRDVRYTREDPPFGGPVAGLAAGLAALETGRPGGAPGWVLLLAVDVPRAARAVPRLLAAALDAAGTTDGVHLVRDGRSQWLLGMYRPAALRRALHELGDSPHGASMRQLVTHLACVEQVDTDDASLDVDTWDDVGRLTVGEHDDVTGAQGSRPPDPAGGTA